MSERTAMSGLDLPSEPIHSFLAQCSKIHHIGSLPGLVPKALAKQVCDIRLVIYDQYTHAHDAASAIVVW
jgi:hypothetical protein